MNPVTQIPNAENVPILGAGKQVPQETLEQVADALGNALMYLFSVDQSNAYVNASTEVQPRPLTVKVKDALEAVRVVLEPQQ